MMNMGKTKVYPNAPAAAVSPDCYASGAGDSMELTVWKKSLLPHCVGFTVFGANGNLAYRVDSYSSGTNKGEIVLMDAAGSPLLTFRRKRLSLWDTWMVFDDETSGSPRLVVKKSLQMPSPGGSLLARVVSGHGRRKSSEAPLYEVEGSYQRRCCTVYDQDRKRRVVEMKPKEAPVRGAAFGGDVFRLVVNPGIDAPAAMAIVILLDQMFS